MSAAHPSSPCPRWRRDRIARLGFLLGRGLSARAVAEDPLIATTIANVHRQARRFGLAFQEADDLRLPADVAQRLGAAADKRNLSRDGLVRLILLAAGSDETLIDNILDDEA